MSTMVKDRLSFKKERKSEESDFQSCASQNLTEKVD